MSSKVYQYEGQDIVVTYDVKRCIHAAKCVQNLPSVFDTEKRPWVNPDAATADDVAAVIQQCPTGALQYTRKDGGAAEPAPADNTVRIKADGPLYVNGNIEIRSADGTVVHTDTRVALCRCGASKNKPFCDNRHKESGFSDPGTVAD